MAGDAGYSHRRVVDRVASEAPTRIRLLVLPVQQRAVDCLGMARPRLCAYRAASRAGSVERPGSLQE